MIAHLFHLTVTAALVAGSSMASAEPLHRSNWVPNVGELGAAEQPLGDMWTFKCPPGGTVSAAVDTKDDTDDGRSDIDPMLVVLDGQGNLLGFGDDEEGCTYPPVCGFDCPSVRVACGEAGRHSIVVRDFGASKATRSPCQEGGGYTLTLEVRDASGRQLPETKVALGGGSRRSVPGWALKQGAARAGPLLDDENVPTGVKADKAVCVAGPGSVTCEASASASASR